MLKNLKINGIPLIFSSPVIVYNTAYFGSDDSIFYAIDIITGMEKWKFKAGSYIWSSPAVNDGIVHFDSWDGYLYAVE